MKGMEGCSWETEIKRKGKGGEGKGELLKGRNGFELDGKVFKDGGGKEKGRGG